MLGTFYGDAQARPRSATNFNLGYDAAEGERYPWVRELTIAPGNSLGGGSLGGDSRGGG